MAPVSPRPAPIRYTDAMATVEIDGTTIAYEIIGERSAGRRRGSSRPAGASPRTRPASASWPRRWPRTASGCSSGTARTPARPTSASPATSESEMQADRLAGLLRALDLAPAVIVGGSGGARVSLLTAARHPDVASKLAMWWISGGTVRAADARDGLLRRVDPRRVAGRHGSGRRAARVGRGARAQSRQPAALPRSRPARVHRDARTVDARVLPRPRRDRSRPARRRVRGARRCPRSCSAAARAIRTTRARRRSAARGSFPARELVEPPWGDREWIERSDAARAGTGGLFERWPLLAPQLLEFAGSLIATRQTLSSLLVRPLLDQ